MTQPRSYSLHELLSSVRRCIEASFIGQYWVRAETSDVRRNMTSGHCYMELLEKSERNTIRARVRANIWNGSYQQIEHRMRQAGLGTLTSDMNILALVQLQYHEQYGLSLIILDVDPSYSLGEIARLRLETIKRLQDAGVYTDNKAYTLPRPLQRLAIISSPTAAGYEDFMNQLRDNAYALQFYTALYPAQMQGDGTTPSIISALDRIAKHAEAFDAVIIIRGGGSVSELRAFDDYELCYYCTQYPLPIISGIGHERDQSVLDLVVHTSLKTPTAVAEYLIHTMLEELNELLCLVQRLSDATALLSTERHRKLMSTAGRLPAVAGRSLQAAQRKQSGLQTRIITTAQTKLYAYRRHLDSRAEMLPHHIIQSQRRRYDTLNQIAKRLSIPIKAHQNRYIVQIERYEQAIRLSDPRNILSRGFALVEHDGKILTRTEQIPRASRLTLHLSDGNISVTTE